MPKAKQTKNSVEVPKKLPPARKQLREDLLNRKSALIKKGWEIDTDSRYAFKRFEQNKVNAELKGAVSVEHLLSQAEALEEFYAGASPGAENSSRTVDEINVSSIIPSPFEPQVRRRAAFETEEGKAAILSLGDSIISTGGLIQPVVVRPVKFHKDSYELACGERRWLAHRAKGIEKISAVVRDLTDAQVIELQYKENHDRHAPDPLNDAFTFQYLIEHENYTEDRLADRFATTRKNVRKKLSLNKLIPEARQELEDGDLPLKHAYYIASFPEAAQNEITREAYAYKWQDKTDGAAPFEDFKEEVEENIVRRLAEAPFDTSDERLHLKKLKCGDCADNSDNQKLLFDDRLGENAVCLNKNCFQMKANVHLRLKQEEIALKANPHPDVPVETKIAEVPLVSSRPSVNKKELPVKGNVLTSQQILDEPECEFSEIGMAIDGEKKGREVYVCKNKKCPVHHPKTVNPAGDKKELSEEDKRAKENQFQRNVSNALRLKVFAESLKFFDDVRVFWQFDDLIQKLIAEFMIELEYDEDDILYLIKDFKNAPKNFSDEEKVRHFVSMLDKANQSRLLFLLAYRSELATDHKFTGKEDDTAEIRRITANFTKLDYDRLETEIRLELAPETED